MADAENTYNDRGELLVVSFSSKEEAAEVRDHLLGRQELPWENVMADGFLDGNYMAGSPFTMATAGAHADGQPDPNITEAELIAMNPLLYSATDANLSATAGAMSGHGREESAAQTLMAVPARNGRHLALLVTGMPDEKLLQEIANHGGEITRTTLDRDEQERVERMLAKHRDD